MKDGLPSTRGNLEFPLPEHLTSLMQEVFSDRETARLKGRRARQDVLDRWTWKSGADLALARIREISSGFPGKTVSIPENGTSRDQGKTASASTFCVRWEGLQFAWHSMALINREVCLRLIDGRHELSILRYLPKSSGRKDAGSKSLP